MSQVVRPYGDTTGETDEYGLPVRYPWAEDYRGVSVRMRLAAQLGIGLVGQGENGRGEHGRTGALASAGAASAPALLHRAPSPPARAPTPTARWAVSYVPPSTVVMRP